MGTPIFSFPPIVDNKSRVLILGTMPGKESLLRNEYYAHPRNAFWQIMFSLFGQTYSDNYQIKKKLLLDHGIALWDVLKVCERHSSLDSDITVEEPNDFDTFFIQYPKIEAIFFNGQPAARFFKKYVSVNGQLSFILPSTSPAHAVNMDHKLSKWMAVKDSFRL
jgi:double-stranded uracil-DNA glycosylase